MSKITEEYYKIIDKLDKLLHPLDKKIDLENSIERYVVELYEVALLLYKFKEINGDLKKNYGEGFLIARFFYHIDRCYPSNHYNKINQDLVTLDKKNGAETDTYIYRDLVKEHIEFLQNWNHYHPSPHYSTFNEDAQQNLVIQQAENLSLKIGIPTSNNRHFGPGSAFFAQLNNIPETRISILNKYNKEVYTTDEKSYSHRIIEEKTTRKNLLCGTPAM